MPTTARPCRPRPLGWAYHCRGVFQMPIAAQFTNSLWTRVDGGDTCWPQAPSRFGGSGSGDFVPRKGFGDLLRYPVLLMDTPSH